MFTLTTFNLEDAIKEVNKFEMNINGKIIEKIMNQIGVVEVARVKKNFSLARSAEGKQWKPLKKKRKDGSDRPLLDKGYLVGSINYRIKGNKLEIGSNMHYAPYHQLGTKRIPKRPYLPEDGVLPPEWNKDILKIIANQLKI